MEEKKLVELEGMSLFPFGMTYQLVAWILWAFEASVRLTNVQSIPGLEAQPKTEPIWPFPT